MIDTLGPGQQFAVTTIEVCSRVITRGNGVTIWWVRAHGGAPANEVADRYAKSAATGKEPVDAIPEGYAGKTSLSHMTRVANGGQIQRDGRVNHGTRATRETIQAPSGERP